MDWEAHRREAHALGRTQEFLKQIVYGGNDGIVTTFAVVSGFAGAQADGTAQIGGLAVLVFGLANLFADAVSMGLGEFLSLRSEHDLYRNRHASKMLEIRQDPAQEQAELVHILRQHAVPANGAATLADLLIRYPQFTGDLMMTYEFAMLDPDEENPALSGFMTFIAFLVFGAVPLIPYFLLEPEPSTFWLSVGATGATLIALGIVRWNASGERLLRSVGETVLVGTVCAVVAYGVGAIVGSG